MKTPDSGPSDTPDSSPAKRTAYCRINDVIGERFKVLVKLGEGGYGEIYKALDTTTNLEVAVKIEEADEKRPNMEPSVLTKFQNHKHCPILYARGLWEDCTFLAMQLLGKNLASLQKQCPFKPPRFSLNTCLRIAIQCIEAVESLHNIGYLHRDIGPTNFAIGLETKNRSLIYLLDYGLCRGYLKADGSLRPRRTSKIGFRGTIKYASVNAHELTDLSRLDDMWSLYYMLYEFIFGQLPWKDLQDNNFVYRLKLDHKPENEVSPPELLEFVKLIQPLDFNDTPPYNLMIEIFQRGIKRIYAKIDDPLDWQVKDCTLFYHWTRLDSGCFLS